ncbi:MAG: ROK family transcriptional regulator [Acetobacteraceae bacterium]|nr:ROK family transcriptional regulator [Acetobacteraceae bacterium]
MPELAASSVARQLSVRAVIEAMLARGRVSRAELARITQLSKQTISEVVRALEDSGWIAASGQVQGTLGRSAAIYELCEDAALVLGIDLGGTKLHVVLATLLGTVIAEAVEATDRRGGAHVVAQIGAIAKRLLAQAGRRGAGLAAAAMGCPGVVEPATGAVDIAPNVPGFGEMNVVAALERSLGCRTLVENDVNLAAKGEQWQGSCRDVQTFVLVALGTGIGMGLVADGRLVRGARGAAGEIAYLPLGADPFDSRLFRYGTLETAVGSRAILERYRGHGGREAEDVREVFERLGEGDKAAGAALDETARLLTQALMAVRAMLDPARIVLGGSVGVRPELIGRVRALSDSLLPAKLPIEPSALGARGTVVGAVGSALAGLYEEVFGLSAPLPELALPPVPA